MRLLAFTPGWKPRSPVRVPKGWRHWVAASRICGKFGDAGTHDIWSQNSGNQPSPFLLTNTEGSNRISPSHSCSTPSFLKELQPQLESLDQLPSGFADHPPKAPANRTQHTRLGLLFPPWVIVRIDIVELEGRHSVNLHHDLSACHRVMMHVWVEIGEAAGRELSHLRLIEAIAHSDSKGPA